MRTTPTETSGHREGDAATPAAPRRRRRPRRWRWIAVSVAAAAALPFAVRAALAVVWRFALPLALLLATAACTAGLWWPLLEDRIGVALLGAEYDPGRRRTATEDARDGERGGRRRRFGPPATGLDLPERRPLAIVPSAMVLQGASCGGGGGGEAGMDTEEPAAGAAAAAAMAAPETVIRLTEFRNAERALRKLVTTLGREKVRSWAHLLSPDPAFPAALELLAANAVACVARRVVGAAASGAQGQQTAVLLGGEKAAVASPVSLYAPSVATTTASYTSSSSSSAAASVASSAADGRNTLHHHHHRQATPPPPPLPGSAGSPPLDFVAFAVARVIPAFRAHLEACKAAADRAAAARAGAVGCGRGDAPAATADRDQTDADDSSQPDLDRAARGDAAATARQDSTRKHRLRSHTDHGEDGDRDRDHRHHRRRHRHRHDHHRDRARRHATGWALLLPDQAAFVGPSVLRFFDPDLLHPALAPPNEGLEGTVNDSERPVAAASRLAAWQTGYLCKIADRVVPFLLPESEARCKLFRLLARDVIVAKVLTPLVNMLADPGFWERLFGRLADDVLSKNEALFSKISEAVAKQTAEDLRADGPSPRSKKTRTRTRRSTDASQKSDNNGTAFKYPAQIRACSNVFEARLVQEFVEHEVRVVRTLPDSSPRQERKLMKAARSVQKRIRRLERSSRAWDNDFCSFILEDSLACSYFIEYLTVADPAKIEDVELWRAMQDFNRELSALSQPAGSDAAAETPSHDPLHRFRRLRSNSHRSSYIRAQSTVFLSPGAAKCLERIFKRHASLMEEYLQDKTLGFCEMVANVEEKVAMCLSKELCNGTGPSSATSTSLGNGVAFLVQEFSVLWVLQADIEQALRPKMYRVPNTQRVPPQKLSSKGSTASLSSASSASLFSGSSTALAPSSSRPSCFLASLQFTRMAEYIYEAHKSGVLPQHPSLPRRSAAAVVDRDSLAESH
ncbi:PXA domain-containing protein, partial [Zopfochytrium polystomum]